LTQPSICVDNVRVIDFDVPAETLSPEQAVVFADWFACLADSTRVRILHAVASTPGGLTVGELAEQVDVSQSTCSHHVRKLAEPGFVLLTRAGTTTVVSVNHACCTGLPHAADVVMGALGPRPCCSDDELPTDVQVREMDSDDWDDVRTIYSQGIATGDATFETVTPSRRSLEQRWLPGHRWVAEHQGRVVGWAAAAHASPRSCYAGVAESSVYVASDARGRGVGKALLHQQVKKADEGGLWTLQTSVFPENRASLALHHAAGFRTVGLRERIAEHHGTWRDTVLLERRAA
jgi:L-amino acid N-acyltransferase YncA/DNA-binding transcriptional ArsR family regulator